MYGSVINVSVGHYRRCYFRPRRVQVHLRSHLPRQSLPPHAPEEPAGYGYLGCDLPVHLDHCLGYRRVHPRVQRVAKFDRMFPPPVSGLCAQSILMISHRVPSSAAGSAVSPSISITLLSNTNSPKQMVFPLFSGSS